MYDDRSILCRLWELIWERPTLLLLQWKEASLQSSRMPKVVAPHLPWWPSLRLEIALLDRYDDSWNIFGEYFVVN